jgi:hypothetical protein
VGRQVHHCVSCPKSCYTYSFSSKGH